MGGLTTPLRYRLPNPPPVFVGRVAELRAIMCALERCPVALLCGPGGIGKTALALSAMDRLPGLQRERALLIEVRPGQPVEDPRLQIIHALATVLGAQVDWSGALIDDHTIGGTLIDLAESGGFKIVLDDLHHAEPGAISRLLSLLARYARASCWIVTSRASPQVIGIAPQVVSLGGLSEDELLQLASANAPELAARDLQSTVAAAGGSPWALLQAMAAPELRDPEDRALGGLTADALRFMKALAPLDRALPLDTIASFTAVPGPEVLDALLRRGLLLQGHAGYRLHDMIGRILSASPDRDERASPRETGRSLTAQDNADLLLEGTRLLLRSGAVTEALSTLERVGERLIAEGQAPRLWQLLQQVNDRRVARWRLRVAVELGQPALLEGLEEPSPGGHAEQLLWAKALLIQGRLSDAQILSQRLREEAEGRGDARSAVDAAVIEVESLQTSGRYVEAYAVLQRVPPASDAATGALLDAQTARCLALQDRPGACLRADRLQATLGGLPRSVQKQVLTSLAATYGLLDRLEDQLEACRALSALGPPTRTTCSALCLGYLNLGRLVEASAALKRLEALCPEGSDAWPGYQCTTIYHRLLAGELGGLEGLLTAAKEAARRAGRPHILARALRHEISYRALRGEAPRILGYADEVTHETPDIELACARWAARAGHPLPPWFKARFDASSAADPNSAFVNAALTAATAACVEGDLTGALEHTRNAEASADFKISLATQMNVLHLRCDVLLTLSRWPALAQTAQALAAVGTRAGSPRVQHEASFYLAVLPSEPVAWAALERLAAMGDVAPIASRRAAHLLGDDALLDALDNRVLHALREHRGVVQATAIGPADLPAWGLAEEGRRVWLADGRTRSLDARPFLWALLRTLIERGGTATKETLVQAVWGVARYHPLRHDNRLRVAVHKLRQIVEQDPAQPVRLVTTEDGYALGGRLRYAALGPIIL